MKLTVRPKKQLSSVRSAAECEVVADGKAVENLKVNTLAKNKDGSYTVVVTIIAEEEKKQEPKRYESISNKE